MNEVSTHSYRTLSWLFHIKLLNYSSCLLVCQSVLDKVVKIVQNEDMRVKLICRLHVSKPGQQD